MCKHIFLRKAYVHFKVSCMHSSYDLCACAHAHSLEGTLTRFVLGVGLMGYEFGTLFLHVSVPVA